MMTPHLARSMISIGMPEETIRKFINKVLHPEHR